MRFEFATTTRIIFGPGVLHEVVPSAAAMGRGAELEAPPLKTFSLKSSLFPDVVAKARNASSVKGNPIVLMEEELLLILEEAHN
jgi:hypothetical protein